MSHEIAQHLGVGFCVVWPTMITGQNKSISTSYRLEATNQYPNNKCYCERCFSKLPDAAASSEQFSSAPETDPT